MIYFKSEYNQVFAYSKSNIEQVSRLSELDLILAEKEPEFIDAKNKLHETQLALNEMKDLSDSELSEDERLELDDKIRIAENNAENALTLYSQIESEYQPLKSEFDAILPVFFDIRENLKITKKMSAKEVEAHLNPPVSKEQLIEEAGQQKQSLLVEANNVIAPLQDAVDLGMATGEEIALLKEWKKYRVLLNRIDTSLAPDIEWTRKP